MAKKGHKLIAAGTALLIAEPALALAHTGGVGVIVGLVAGAAAYVAVDDLEKATGKELPLPASKPAEESSTPEKPSLAYRLLNGKSTRLQDMPPGDDQSEETNDTDNLFALEHAEQPLPCERLQMKDIIAHLPANGYRVYLGRSVLIEGNPARSTSILKQHLKIIGASQKGKSSMAGCILEQIIQTHDLDHALIAILDLEDRTGKLFENDPHIVTFRMNGRDVKMHARTKEQVFEYLGYIVQLMHWRSTLPVTEVVEMPLLIVYIEEFLALKDHYKLRIATAKDAEATKRAQGDYDTLIYNISELARLGLKLRIQLLMCAQVDYRDDDLYEALANIIAGMSFCVKPSAAQAAGFTDAEMLKKNRKDNIVGQAVAEFSGCKDMVLAPDFPLEQKLIELEKRQGRRDAHRTSGTTLASKAQEQFQPRQDDRDASSSEREEGDFQNIPNNVRTFPLSSVQQPVEQADDASQDRPQGYRFTEQEIPLLLAAYRASGNIDKACQALHKSAPRYRQHAKEILVAHNARRA